MCDEMMTSNSQRESDVISPTSSSVMSEDSNNDSLTSSQLLHQRITIPLDWSLNQPLNRIETLDDSYNFDNVWNMLVAKVNPGTGINLKMPVNRWETVFRSVHVPDDNGNITVQILIETIHDFYRNVISKDPKGYSDLEKENKEEFEQYLDFARVQKKNRASARWLDIMSSLISFEGFNLIDDNTLELVLGVI